MGQTRHPSDGGRDACRFKNNQCGVLPSLTSLRPLLRDVLRDQGALGLRERNIAVVLIDAAGIAEILDGALRLEAVAAPLEDRIARDPDLITSHACVAAAAIDAAAHRAFLLHDLGDTGAL